MTSLRPRVIALIRRGLLIATATALALALAACAGAAAQVPLPIKSAVRPAATFASPAPAPVPRQQVLAALTGYAAALGQASKSVSTSVARKLLQPYLAASRIGGVVDAMSTIWARGETFYGVDVLHISSVTVDRRRAFVHDCDDTSSMGLVSSGTGQIVPGSSGVQHVNLITRLDLVRGHWLVKFQLIQDVPCAP
jgi:hypothetical protein